MRHGIREWGARRTRSGVHLFLQVKHCDDNYNTNDDIDAYNDHQTYDNDDTDDDIETNYYSHHHLFYYTIQYDCLVGCFFFLFLECWFLV